MTFQRKLLFGFSLMVLPALLVGAEAIRSNVARARALQALGESMARTRTYAELETAMFDQSEIIWRYLSGLDPTARQEFELTGEVVDYWQQRWRAELRPEEMALADGVAGIQRQIVAVADSIFELADAGHRDSAYRLAQRGAQGTAAARAHPDEPGDLPARAGVECPRRVRPARGDPGATKAGVSRPSSRLSLAAGLGATWLISRSLARP